jgi:hypothetical protein
MRVSATFPLLRSFRWTAFGPHLEEFFQLFHCSPALVLALEDQIVPPRDRSVAVAQDGLSHFNIDPGVEQDANEPPAKRMPATKTVTEDGADVE